MTLLDCLPIEIHHLIFGYLNLIEICTCRLVCKKFNETVKSFRVRKLMFYASNWNRRFFWYYDAKPIYTYNTLNNSKLAVLNSTSIDFQCLKRLRLQAIEETNGFLLETVNKFENLVDLELSFEIENWFSGSRSKKLKLNNLRRLFINIELQVFIEFDTPKLESVALDYEPHSDFGYVNQPVETIRFTSPSTVSKLITFNLLQNEMPMNFTGLEHLQCDVLLDLDLNYILSTFPALKVLDIVLNKQDRDLNCNEALDRILQEKAQLRPSLRIYFQGIELSGRRSIESFGFDKENRFALLFKHRSSLLAKGYPRHLNYNELLSLTKQGFSIDFLESQPFSKTFVISTNDRIDDPNRFLNFLLRCPNVWSLKLENCSLDMAFFEKLPEFTSLLELEIKSEIPILDLQLEFGRFLLRMTNLNIFITDQQISVDLLRNLVQKLKFVDFLDFKLNGQKCTIKKISGDRYKLKIYDNFPEEYNETIRLKSTSDLLKYLNDELVSEYDDRTDDESQESGEGSEEDMDAESEESEDDADNAAFE